MTDGNNGGRVIQYQKQFGQLFNGQNMPVLVEYGMGCQDGEAETKDLSDMNKASMDKNQLNQGTDSFEERNRFKCMDHISKGSISVIAILCFMMFVGCQKVSESEQSGILRCRSQMQSNMINIEMSIDDQYATNAPGHRVLMPNLKGDNCPISGEKYLISTNTEAWHSGGPTNTIAIVCQHSHINSPMVKNKYIGLQFGASFVRLNEPKRP